MPELKIETIRKSGETYQQTYDRLRMLARGEKDKILATRDFSRIFSPDPGIREEGNKLILTWKYKQYPLT